MTALDLRAVTVVAGGHPLLQAVDLRLVPGDFVAVVGPNGAGKSTLLRTAVGLCTPAHGSVTLGGHPVRDLAPRERAGYVAWLPQVLATAEPIAVEEIVVAARFRFSEPHARSIAAARSALTRVGAASLGERLITELSGGERQRVALAALLAQSTPLVLLDEPANHLDPAQQIASYRLIGSLWDSGSGVLCVTHDVNLLAHLGGTRSPRVLGMAEGRVRFEQSWDAPGLPDALGDLFGTRMRAIEAEGRRLIVPEARGR
jgi:iron complex transport system ATP-binding protein